MPSSQLATPSMIIVVIVIILILIIILPVSALRAQDLPLKFSWHDWTESFLAYQTQTLAEAFARTR